MVEVWCADAPDRLKNRSNSVVMNLIPRSPERARLKSIGPSGDGIAADSEQICGAEEIVFPEHASLGICLLSSRPAWPKSAVIRKIAESSP